MIWLANIAYSFAALFYLPVLLWQMLFQGKNRRGWGEKLFGPRAFPAARSGGRIWIHAVSLGEINATRGIVEQLEERLCDCDVVISTTTDTGYARAVSLYGADRVIRYPLDFSWAVNRALRRVKPALIVLVELEVWPNLVALATRRGVPVAIVNGRLTERSCKRLRRLSFIARRMFRPLAWIGVQDDATAARFRSVGANPERVCVTGSVKWDTAAISDRIEGQEELEAAVGIDPSKPLWVCGSTGVAEEAPLIDVYDRLRTDFPDLQLALVPRKPERFNEVANLIERRGYHCIRRSERPDRSTPQLNDSRRSGTDDQSRKRQRPSHGPQSCARGSDGPRGLARGDSCGNTPEAGCDAPDIILGDTMGELRKFYALATVVFVGRSLVPMGGSDPMEAAALGKPLVVGPHMDNFALPTQTLEAEGALVVAADADAVFEETARLLRHADIAAESAAAGQRTVRANQGATRRTVDAIAAFL